MKALLLLAFAIPCWGQTELALLGAGKAANVAALIQQTTCTSVTATLVCTLGSTPSAANVLMFVANEANPGFTVVSVTSVGATWAQLPGALSNTNRSVSIWCATLTGTPGTVVTLTWSTLANFDAGNVSEWSNASCIADPASAVASNGTSATATTGNLTTTLNADLIIAASGHASSTFVSGPSNGFTGLTSPDSTRYFSGYFAGPNAGTYFTSFTWNTSGIWDTVIVGVK